MLRWSPVTQKCAFLATLLLAASLIDGPVFGTPREQLIPILGVTTGQKESGRHGLLCTGLVRRTTGPDRSDAALPHNTRRFSRMAQTSIEQAIRRSARSLGVSIDSWTVELSVPYAGMTIYGDSVSAMVSLSVAAMAQGKTVSTGHVLTGTVTPDGEIGPIGSVPLKVQAARAAKLRRVVVSKHTPAGEHAGNLPVSIQVSPVQSVPEALDALTDSPPMKSTIIEVEQR